MPRLFLLLVSVCVLLPIACRLPPEREPLRPLPEDGSAAGFTYKELLDRAHAQFSVAIDAFYADSWKDLEEAAKGLEQTARFLPKSAAPPAGLKEDVIARSKALRAEAVRLGDAARLKKVDDSNDALKNINLHVRSLRPPEVRLPEPK
ncbi:MAG: hypothetical protein U0793_32580 [Gemmataceae bacterium]